MPDSSEVPPQICLSCGATVDLPEAEPLERVPCPACGETLRIERAFDHFVLLEMLGVGGMGSVYKARDTRLDRFVALKLLHAELSDDPTEAARLEQEARVTASLNHPNAIQVYSTGRAHGQIYLVMELVDHGSLDDLMAEKRRVPEEQLLAAAIQVAKGLAAAHAKGLIHRDVKPANILFSDAQTAKIGDFGLAVVAEQNSETQNEIWGTPYYVAPERLDNAPEDFRSDIFSLGATLFHALAGTPPITAETTSASELRKLKDHPPDLHALAPDVSRTTARLINRMLAPDPADRFASYAELIAQLQQAKDSLGKRGSGAKQLSLIGAALVLAIVVGAAVYFMRKPKPAAPVALAAAATATPTPDNSAELRREETARRSAATRAKKKLAAEAEKRERADNDAREAERKKLLAEESPAWEKALSDAQNKITLYDFADARAALDAAKLTEPSLVEAQTTERKRISWLADWKKQLIADLRSGRVAVPVKIGNAQYQGATTAEDAQITFRLPPYGTAAVAWTNIPPAELLKMSTSLIQANSGEAADRQWLAAIFAQASGQTAQADSLGAAAAQAKPEYAAELKQFFPAHQ